VAIRLLPPVARPASVLYRRPLVKYRTISFVLGLGSDVPSSGSGVPSLETYVPSEYFL
jgi:hypothetical protein